MSAITSEEKTSSVDDSPEFVRLPLSRNAVGQGVLLTTLALLAFGVVMVHSALASVASPGEWYARVDVRHTAFAILAALVLLLAWRLNYRRLAAGSERWPWLAMCLLIVAMLCAGLVYVPGVGYSVGGFHRWVRLGPARYSIGFQPSELIKLSLVVFLAAWLTRPHVPVRKLWVTAIALGIIGVCMAAVIQEDFGTAMLIAVAGGVTLLLSGTRWYYLLILIGMAALAVYRFVYLDPYRWGRIVAGMNPWDVSNPTSFQVRESLLAVISGQWTGTGLGMGMIKQGFLPEDSTDFIFAVVCEELGLVGAFLLLGLLLVWIWQVRRASLESVDPFGRVLAGAFGFLIALQAVLHVGVDLVVLPPKGLGFPFVSAGGTSLVIMAFAVAAIVSVTSRRPAG